MEIVFTIKPFTTYSAAHMLYIGRSRILLRWVTCQPRTILSPLCDNSVHVYVGESPVHLNHVPDVVGHDMVSYSICCQFSPCTAVTRVILPTTTELACSMEHSVFPMITVIPRQYWLSKVNFHESTSYTSYFRLAMLILPLDKRKLSCEEPVPAPKSRLAHIKAHGASPVDMDKTY